jgi:cytochrome c nitrite reductase small subunit
MAVAAGRRRWLDVLSWTAVGLAVVATLLVFAFLAPPLSLSERFSRPVFCASCHNMRPEFAAFRTSAHSNLPSCNDCHLPNDNGLAHFFWDGVFGTRDLVSFYVLGRAPYDATATPTSQRIIQANCVRCHNAMLGHTDVSSRRCWDCHRIMNHRLQLETMAGRRGVLP